MPQELQVLRCYSCHFFQVHIVKKSRKWECKMCGEKQSIKKVYGRGSGRDCRVHVQKLNELAALQQESQIAVYGSVQQADPGPEDNAQNIHTTVSADFHNCRKLSPSVSSSSKWSVYLDQPENESKEEENAHEFSGSLKQNSGYSLESFGKSMEQETAICNAQCTESRNRRCYQNQDGHLNKALNSTPNSLIDAVQPDNIYKNKQENSFLKPSENKWFKYIEDKTKSIQRDSSITQLPDHKISLQIEKESVYDESMLLKSSSKWDMCLQEPTYQTGGNNLIKTSPQLTEDNKIFELTQTDNNAIQCQQSSFSSNTLRVTEKQLLSRTDVIKTVNMIATDINKLSSSNTFDRDYSENELDDILDI